MEGYGSVSGGVWVWKCEWRVCCVSGGCGSVSGGAWKCEWRGVEV